MEQAYWRIKNKCNKQCRHCGYNCGPDGESVSIKDARIIIDHLPQDLNQLEITGGEPMVVRPLLRAILKYIQSKTFPKLKVELQTNGFWVTDREITYNNLVWLSGLGVRAFDFTGNDKYHREQGINTQNLDIGDPNSTLSRAIKKFNQEYKDESREFYLRGASEGFLPFGRGKNLPSNEMRKQHCSVGLDSTHGEESLTIDPFGEVYPCCYQMPYSIGNAIHQPLEEIIEQARQDSIISTLSHGGLSAVAKKFWIFGDYSSNPCGRCEELFSKLKKRGICGANAAKAAGVVV